jgi:pseudouridine-5'-phosphate glycosidase
MRGLSIVRNKLPRSFVLKKEIVQARELGVPVVALESAVITHGLPQPENLNLARDMEVTVRENGAVPATIALLDGRIHVGLSDSQLIQLAHLEESRKISMRDFGIAISRRISGGTTVAASLFVASQAGIRVFATGGIGGVHRGAPFDVSADLLQLGKTPVLVVCAGAKAILDLTATREVLETQGIPVIGYQTDEFPAFYTRSSGLPVDMSVDTPEEAVQVAVAAWEAGLKSAVLLVVPPPQETALEAEKMESAIVTAIAEAVELNIQGSAMTPFLLNRVSELTDGESLQANLALLKNNARIAGKAAAAMAGSRIIGPF